MNIFATFNFTLLLWFGMALAIRPDRSKFSVRSNSCWSDPEYAVDILCQFKPLRYKFGNFSYGYTYKKPVNDTWFYVETYKRISTNAYQRGAINFKENLCSIAKYGSTYLFQFLPVLQDMIGKYLSPCPSTGRREMINMTVANIESALFSYLGTGHYKVLLHFAHGETNATFFKIDLLLYFKGLSLFET